MNHTLRITVRIIDDQSGKPIGGAKVGIFEGETQIVGMISPMDGSLALSTDIRPASSRLKVVVTAQGFHRQERAIRSDEETDLVFRLKRVVPPITGRVTSENGEPIIGAKIAIFDGTTEIARTTSGAEGRFTLPREIESASPRLKVVVTAEGFQRLERAIRSEEETDLLLQLRLPSRRITGRVTSENGEPIIGAEIAIFDGKREIAGTTSGADGRFALSLEIESASPRLKAVVTAERFQRLKKLIRSEETDLLLQLRRPWWFFLVRFDGWIFVTILAIFLVVGAFAVWHLIPPGRKVEVPSLKEKPVEEAKAALEKLNLTYTVEQRQVTGDEAPGTVIEQKPQPPAKVDRGSNVALVIGKRPERERWKVPDLTGIPADKLLEVDGTANFKFKEVKNVTAGRQRRGYIDHTDPPAGTEADIGSLVTVFVEQGSTVPDVIEMTIAQAKTALEKLNLTWTVENRQVIGEEEPGTVVEQNPQSLAKVDGGSKVALVVGTPRPSPAPEETCEAAIKEATDAALANRYAAALLSLNETLQKFPQCVADVEAEIEKVAAKLRKDKGVLNKPELDELEQPLRQAANAHSVSAQMLLGNSLKRSNSIDALKFFQMAADAGNSEASFELGEMHANGLGTAKSFERAIPYYRKAADAEEPRAMYALGECYYYGKGVPKDRKRAFYYLSRAAGYDNPHAQNRLGDIYRKGNGLFKPNYAYAFELFSKATQLGYLDAQANLGVMYINGEIGPGKDPKRAVGLWKDGAEKNNPQCMFLYARSLERGVLPPKQPGQARIWYARAASLGHSEAKKWCLDKNVPFATPAP